MNADELITFVESLIDNVPNSFAKRCEKILFIAGSSLTPPTQFSWHNCSVNLT